MPSQQQWHYLTWHPWGCVLFIVVLAMEAKGSLQLLLLQTFSPTKLCHFKGWRCCTGYENGNFKYYP